MPGVMHLTVSAPAPAVAQAPPVSSPTSTRITSIDAFRGFVMFLMLAEAMRLWTLHEGVSGEPLLVDRGLQHLARPVAGVFAPRSDSAGVLVPGGAALPFSIANRRARGETFGRMLGHAVWRSVALILLGIFLRSLERPQTYWTFEDTLTQIGLGYTFLFLLAFASLRVQIVGVRRRSSSASGARSCCIRCPARTSTTRRSACPRTGRICTPGFLAHFNKNSNLVVGVRRLVPEPVPAREAVPLQRAAAGRR